MLENLHFTKKLGQREPRRAVGTGEAGIRGFMMATHWEHKKRRSPGMTSGPIDELYELARRERSAGRKAGWRGWRRILDVVHRKIKRGCDGVMRGAGLREVRLQFDFGGTTVMAHS